MLKILLSALVALSAADLCFSAIYMIDYDLFNDHLYPASDFVESISGILLAVILIVFLIWIYRVHADLNRLFLQYARKPIVALLCVIIPIFNFYGLPSTFLHIGSRYQRTPALRKAGGRISGLAVPLILLELVTVPLNRAMSGTEDVPGALMFAYSLVSFATHVIYLALTLLVSRGLHHVHARAGEEPGAMTFDNGTLERPELPFPARS
ncbi:hypothetical protein [Paenibacillus sp. UNC496MF]|uniref:hypothetical protein n=1 Tax=Paenibacillus sp. UNC496MF TaxID=1502753 RepID=UPI002109DFB2|nr:hypothetical protein [Paenibacillus sp. UNC496MF]